MKNIYITRNFVICTPCEFYSGDQDKKMRWAGRVEHMKREMHTVTFVYLCIISIAVNDDQKAENILSYLFISNQLYMFRAMYSPIIISTW